MCGKMVQCMRGTIAGILQSTAAFHGVCYICAIF